MLKDKTALLLVNVGTPNNPSVQAVRRYLFQFLNDPRVIDLPWLARKILVNLIIVPFRAPKSAKLYQRLWTDEGSPLLTNTLRLQEKLQKSLDSQADVFVGMRYQEPSIRKAAESIKEGGYTRLIVLPMFPQYASSTSGTASQAVMEEIGKWNTIPHVHFINQFYNHPAFVDAFAQRIATYQPSTYDFVLFSYHGLPNNHNDKGHPGIPSAQCECEKAMPSHGQFCYKAACYETTRLLVEKLNLQGDKFSTAFQSRLSSNWMQPFTDKTLNKLAQKGIKRLLVVAPSFTADCLETTDEIGHEYKNEFMAAGGEQLTLVESLNDSDPWVDALKQILASHL